MKLKTFLLSATVWWGGFACQSFLEFLILC